MSTKKSVRGTFTDDPYPNRREALALLGDAIDPRVSRVLLSRTFGGALDPTLDEWLAEAKKMQEKLRDSEAPFAGAERTHEGEKRQGPGTGRQEVASYDTVRAAVLRAERAKMRGAK